MKTMDVTVVRVYMTEGEHQLAGLLKRLRDREKVRGFTVFRGVSGFGPSGVLHQAAFTDLSLDLPVVVEFFDTQEKVEKILGHIEADIRPGHILTWPASTIISDESE